MRTRWHVSCYISLQCFTLSAHIVQQGKNRKHRKRTKGHKRWKLRSGKEIKRDETTTEYWFPKQVTQEVGDVKHLVTHNDPAVLVGVVLGNLLCADWHADSSWLWKIRSPNRATNLLSQNEFETYHCFLCSNSIWPLWWCCWMFLSGCENSSSFNRASTNLGRSLRLPYVCTWLIMIDILGVMFGSL